MKLLLLSFTFLSLSNLVSADWIEPPEALLASKLPVGSHIVLEQKTHVIVPGAQDKVEVKFANGDNQVWCRFSVQDALFERTIPAAADFEIKKASSSSSYLEFEVVSNDAPFVTRIVCDAAKNGRTIIKSDNDRFFVPTLRCLFKISIDVPPGATNPELKCDL